MLVIPANPPKKEDKSRNPVSSKNYRLRLLSATGGFAGVTGFGTSFEVIILWLCLILMIS